MNGEIILIDFKTTKQFFYYDPLDLSDGSNKSIFLICDYCGCNFNSTPKKRKKSNVYCNKDACKDCKYKKRSDVSMARDGVKNSAQRPEIRTKIKEKNKDWINSEKFNELAKSTMLQKYGVDNPMKSDELKEKLKNKIFEKYGVDNIMKYSNIAKIASTKSINTKIQKGSIQSIDGMTIPKYAKSIGFSRSHFGKLVKKVGIEQAIKHQKKISLIEKSIIDWLDSLSIEYETQFRIENKIADIKIGNVLIECDGLYWHSDLFVDDSYHINKSMLYKQYGYRSLFFRENEINNKFDIVKSIISNTIGASENKYFARKLQAKIIDKKESMDFIDKNHLMGKNKSITSAIGLFDDDKLVSVLQMKNVKDNDYEITRFCSILNTSIIGGFSKLLKCFVNNFNPSKVSTFIDMRYGTGDYLESLGFVKKSCYKSFMWTNGKNTFHRMQFPGNSGYLKGVQKIWDCGQTKFIKLYH
jgi:hypothetical protein